MKLRNVKKILKQAPDKVSSVPCRNKFLRLVVRKYAKTAIKGF